MQVRHLNQERQTPVVEVSDWFANSLSVSKERCDSAEKKIDELTNNLTNICGYDEYHYKAVKSLKTMRDSEYFLNLQKMVTQGLKLLPAEWLYYLLTASNVTAQVHDGMLEKVQQQYAGTFYGTNLKVLLTAYRCSMEKDQYKREVSLRDFCQALLERGSIKQRKKVARPHENDLYRLLFLSLHNMNFSDIKFENVAMEYIDFEGSSFAKARLNHVVISESMFDRTDFSYVDMRHMKMWYTSFKQANMTNAKLHGKYWFPQICSSDLTGAEITIGHSDNRIGLHYSKLYGVTFKGATRLRAMLGTIGTELLHEEAYANPAALQAEMGKLQYNLLDGEDLHRHDGLLVCLAEGISRHCRKSEDKTPEEKIALIDAALDHPILGGHEEDWLEWAARGVANASTGFGLFAESYRKHVSTADCYHWARSRLENARKEILDPPLHPIAKLGD